MPRFLTKTWFLLGLGLWQLLVVFTPVSLYGFWTDVVVFVAALIWIPATLLKGHLMRADAWAAAIIVTACLVIALFTLIPGLAMVASATLASEDRTPSRSSDGIWLLNNRFIPELRATASCPTGSLRLSKALILFPLVEYQTHLEPCVPWTEVRE